MTDEQALHIATEAMKRATDRYGADRAAILRQVEIEMNADQELLTAFSQVGHLLIEATEAGRH